MSNNNNNIFHLLKPHNIVQHSRVYTQFARALTVRFLLRTDRAATTAAGPARYLPPAESTVYCLHSSLFNVYCVTQIQEMHSRLKRQYRIMVVKRLDSIIQMSQSTVNGHFQRGHFVQVEIIRNARIPTLPEVKMSIHV